MATEQFVNDPGTYLTTGCTSSDLTITVVNASGYPTSGNFRIKIDDEIMIVTSVSGAVWTVTRGAESTTATAHMGGAGVSHVFTAGGVTAFRADATMYGTYANRPTGFAGQTYYCTDSAYHFVHNGTSWQAFYRSIPVKVPPSLASLTWVNQGSATAIDTYGTIDMTIPTSGSGDSRQMLLMSAPARPYTFTVGAELDSLCGLYQYHGFNLILRESGSGKLIELLMLENSSSPLIAGQRLNSPTSYSGAEEGNVNHYMAPQLWVRWEVQSGGSGYRRMYFSLNGRKWTRYGGSNIQWDTFLTPDQIGFGGLNQNGGTIPPLNISVFHWDAS